MASVTASHLVLVINGLKETEHGQCSEVNGREFIFIILVCFDDSKCVKLKFGEPFPQTLIHG